MIGLPNGIRACRLAPVYQVECFAVGLGAWANRCTWRYNAAIGSGGFRSAKPSIASLILTDTVLCSPVSKPPFACQRREAELLIPRHPALSRPIRYARLDRY